MYYEDIKKLKQEEQVATYTRIFTSGDVTQFASLTGDHNPLHVSPGYAAQTRFNIPVVHGMLVASMFSKIFGNDFPGPGCIYSFQEVKFVAPVFLGDSVKATVQIVGWGDRNIISFDTNAVVQERLVITGRADVWVPSVPKTRLDKD